MAAVSLQVWNQGSSLFHLQKGSGAHRMATRLGSHLHGLRRRRMLSSRSSAAAIPKNCMVVNVWCIRLRHQAMSDSRADADSESRSATPH